MKILVSFCIDADIIECPKDVSEYIKNYQKDFLEWLFNKENDHNYWMYDNGHKVGCSYRSDAFVEWLNNNVFNDSIEKARVLEVGVITSITEMIEISF